MKTIAWILLISFCCCNGCTKSSPEAEIFEAGRCYEAMIIRTFCPGVAVVAVTNAHVGIDWDWNGKAYRNVVTLLNYGALATAANSPVYFTVDVDATRKGENCSFVIPCPHNDLSAPTKGICANYIANKSCP